MNDDHIIHERAAGEPGTYILRASMHVPKPRAEVFAFFSDARNLETITPASLRFQILTPGPVAMAAGTLIDYRIARQRGSDEVADADLAMVAARRVRGRAAEGPVRPVDPHPPVPRRGGWRDDHRRRGALPPAARSARPAGAPARSAASWTASSASGSGACGNSSTAPAAAVIAASVEQVPGPVPSLPERVAGGDVAGLEAAPEPLDALRRRAVRELLGVHAAPGHPLDPVVADGRRRVSGPPRCRADRSGCAAPSSVPRRRPGSPPAARAAPTAGSPGRAAAAVPVASACRCRATFWTWWPISWAMTYAWANSPAAPKRERSSS